MNTNKPFSRLMALVLSVALMLTGTPLTVFADGCYAHDHDAECGYIEGAECDHDHDENCGYAESAPCGHTHDEACGEDGESCDHAHDEDCSYIEAVPCGHVHDASCGGLSLGESGEGAEAVTVAEFDELEEETLW